ncbi:MAG: hypothetical protein QXZ36_03715 [Thermoproteota archaeon]
MSKRNLAYLLAGFVIGVFSNIIPSWTEHRDILRSADDQRLGDLKEAWLIVFLVSLLALGLVILGEQ